MRHDTESGSGSTGRRSSSFTRYFLSRLSPSGKRRILITESFSEPFFSGYQIFDFNSSEMLKAILPLLQIPGQGHRFCSGTGRSLKPRDGFRNNLAAIFAADLDSPLVISLLLLYLVCFPNVVTTSAVLSHGGVELNPLMEKFAGSLIW